MTKSWFVVAVLLYLFASTGSECPEGFEYIAGATEGMCYKLLEDHPISFAEAFVHCTLNNEGSMFRSDSRDLLAAVLSHYNISQNNDGTWLGFMRNAAPFQSDQTSEDNYTDLYQGCRNCQLNASLWAEDQPQDNNPTRDKRCVVGQMSGSKKSYAYNHDCLDTENIFHAICQRCENVDECAEGTDLCTQECYDQELGYICGCFGGYELQSDSYNCKDIDECATNLHQCNQVCDNVEGGYYCSCDAGYQLRDDYNCASVSVGSYCDNTTGLGTVSLVFSWCDISGTCDEEREVVANITNCGASEHNGTSAAGVENRFVEMLFIFDSYFVETFGLSENETGEAAMRVARVVDRFYDDVNANVTVASTGEQATLLISTTLVDIIIWHDMSTNPISFHTDIINAASEFEAWRWEHIDELPDHDVASLITAMDFGGANGLAAASSICRRAKSTNIISARSDNWWRLGEIVAHELGHNLGLMHTGEGECLTCELTNCLMGSGEQTVPGAPITGFSQCQQQLLAKYLINDGVGPCLRNEPLTEFGNTTD